MKKMDVAIRNDASWISRLFLPVLACLILDSLPGAEPGRGTPRGQAEIPGISAPKPEHPRTEGDFRNITREQVKKSRPLPPMPFVVLTCRGRANAMRDMFSDGAIKELAKLDADLMGRLAASVPGGRQIMVEGTGHHVHVDKPDALIVPVVEMIKQVRETKQD